MHNYFHSISPLNRYQTSRYSRQPVKTYRAATSVSKRLLRGLAYFVIALLLSSIVLTAILRFLPAPTSAFMLHQHIDDLVAGKSYRPIQQHWVSNAQISKYAFAAVIASEDQRFYQHYGFDLDAIYKAYKHNLRGGKLRGASTISQQVAKNLFLSPARNFGRKILEIWFTLLIETLWDKSRILEMYLNIAEFGDHLYGIEAASRHYFGISAKRLSASQAALLAATLPNPAALKADKPTAYLGRRQSWVLRQMRNLEP
ncbi:monofunctional biosynthetic peptidoglycan transglycosylase [Methylomonas sp. LL1]|uniref:monofunctional biosynthetic peptidoglycan transglycosylase n=1 Tax=Methylomonas sp. LL1 TaxID=2785785 RepID=UPI0018C3ED40|nr:monofunctional biosynthetic peptidoglycan transglycosylase [Methylomonas sp. LL1]QPK62293.1 monofunctional biosynthetic peptidoglycan transglycosylase [Methylomonas sp. LL1]